MNTVKKISSKIYQFVGHNLFGFDKYIVLSSLPKSYTSVKIIKTSRGLMKLSFRAGSAYEDDREKPEYAKLVCSECDITGSLKDNQIEYNLQPQFMKGEIAHVLITLSNYEEHESPWKPHLTDDVLT